MKKFYCKGKKDFCEDYDRCLTNCRYFDGSGGGYRKVPMTNANRIRAMSNEELALWICGVYDIEEENGKFINGIIIPGYTPHDIEEWLQQPSGEEDKHEYN